MKIKNLFLVFVLFLAFQMTGFSGPEEWALSVDILPETPTIYDPIDIISSGMAAVVFVILFTAGIIGIIPPSLTKRGILSSIVLMVIVSPLPANSPV